MNTILVTGFEAFLTHQKNPTEALVQKLDGTEVDGTLMKGIVLPVSFARAAEMLIEQATAIRPNAIVMLGLGAGRKQVTPERIAINVMDGPPDNEGAVMTDQPIKQDGPAAYFSTLPIRKMVNELNRHGCPATISNTAGTYVCNDLMYRVLDHLQTAAVPAGFIHVPYTDDMVGEEEVSLPVDTVEKGIRQALRVVASTL
ncbi:pyroglutamyl-peptidase I [Shouchella clausii]|uniref:pyroglutamyl-peptidase I n=1 Tax=Shouchella clausii TaxID=79880 RepID=UPI002040EA79|nr:pyroglutamyl-peptidase I [Shouchella clausii]MCM3550340.1 pyroglutamyl-peptidase I [Shouchella clausii]MCY1105236.1 pyroglutamyl-peptidase I [Shouchella clausii]